MAAASATSQAAKAAVSSQLSFTAEYSAVPAAIYAKYTQSSALIDKASVLDRPAAFSVCEVPVSYFRYFRNDVLSQLLKDAAHERIPHDAAVKIHDFVRDSILFGWDSSFHDRTAGQVIADGRGFCLSKSTLFVTLLRCVGIPSRVVFVDISVRVLHGILGNGRYVDHSYVEVLLPREGGGIGDYTWLAVDSFVIDSAVFDLAMRRVHAEGRTMGYGVHGQGTRVWDGRKDAFSQFMAAQGTGGVSYGDALSSDDVLPCRKNMRLEQFPDITSPEVTPIVSEDARQFYDDANQGGILPEHLPRVPMRGLLKLVFGWVVWPANRAVENLRAEAGQSTCSAEPRL